ncbi:MAG: hypothetical protein RTU92_01515 [Candidatus Thorarchaeota archaeon]
MSRKSILYVVIICFIFASTSSFMLYPNSVKEYNRININDQNIVRADVPDSWSLTWGGIYDEVAYGIATDAADNIYVGGTTATYGGAGVNTDNAFLAKYVAAGTEEWLSIYNTSVPSRGLGVAVDIYNNSYLIGEVDSDKSFVVSYDPDGNQLWNVTLETPYGISLQGCDADNEGSVYVTGYVGSNGTDVFFAKYGPSGNHLWNTTWGGLDYDIGYDVGVSGSSYIYVTGSTNSTGAGDQDILLLRFNPSGAEIWNETLGTVREEYGSGVDVDADGAAYIAGSAENDFGLLNLIVTKYNSTGTNQWENYWNDLYTMYGRDIVVEEWDTVYAVGDVFMSGNQQRFRYECTTSGDYLGNTYDINIDDDYSYGVAVDSMGQIYVAGAIDVGSGFDMYLERVYRDHFPPESVQLVSPSSGTVFGHGTPMMQWYETPDIEPSTGIMGYYLEIDTNPSFSTNDLSSYWVGNVTTHTPSTSLDDGTWYWRVRVKDMSSNNGSWSSARFFAIDTTSPSIDDQVGFSFDEGSTGNFITWNPSDPNPDYYELNRNSVLWRTDSWDGSSLTFNLASLLVGTHNLNLIVYDSLGNSASDTAIIIVNDNTAPVIMNPDDIEFEQGILGTQIVWNASELHPSSYIVLRNGTSVMSDSWDGSDITVPLSGLSPGLYNFTLQVTDSSGNNAMDAVFVTVLKDMTVPRITPHSDLVILDSQSAQLNWTTFDLNPVAYLIELDGEDFDVGSWDGWGVSYNIPSLQPGEYNFTLTVWDVNGNHASDTVILTVQFDVARFMFNVAVTGTVGFVALLFIGSVFVMARRSKRKSALEKLVRVEKTVPVEKALRETGLSLQKLNELVGGTRQIMLTADGHKILWTAAIVESLRVKLATQGRISPKSEGEEYGLTSDQIATLVKASGITVFLNESNEQVTKDHVVNDLVKLVEKDGFVDLSVYAVENGIPENVLLDLRDRDLKTPLIRIVKTSLVASRAWISKLRKTATDLGVVKIDSFAADMGIPKTALETILTTYLSGSFDKGHSTFKVITTPIPTGRPAGDVASQVKALRGGEFVGNRFRYKVKVLNESALVITDVTVAILSYPRDALKLDGDSVKNIAKIDPKGFRSPSFVFLPTQDCVQGDIVASVSFIDSRGHAHSVTTEPYVIRAVCDLLTPETITAEDFALKLSSLHHGEIVSKVEDWTPEEMHAKTLQILKNTNFYEVSSEKGDVGDRVEATITGWAKGKYTGKNVGIEITITGQPGVKGATCKVKMSGEDEAMIMPAMDEITQKLSAWICPKCSANLPTSSVDALKSGKSVECPFCGVTMDR